MEQEVIVRFPPSPTGYLHIGGARTAIFNWLFAQKTGGKFILRIEDTDAERSSAESIQGIIASLKWLGITWDQEPYFQSDFIHEHIAAARKLIDSGHAYKCFCPKEEIEKKRRVAVEKKITFQYDGTCRNLTPDKIAAREADGTPYSIRLKLPAVEGSIVFNDIVYGTIEKKYEDLEDFIIVRTNGQPLYLLSNAVDDIRDKVTHIIRGQDGLGNTPKQILIYRALGATIPVFAHMSLTLDPQKAKISKRTHGELVAVHFYKEHGFLPWALVNFLVRLGWSTSDSRDFFSKKELIEAFSLEGLSRANSIFDIRKNDPKYFTDPKAISINAHYLRTLPLEEIEPYVREQLEQAGIWNPEFETAKRAWYLDTIDLIRSRYHLTTDFVTRGRAYFSEDYPIEPKALKKNVLKHEKLKRWFPILAERLDTVKAFTAEETEKIIRALAEELGIKVGVLTNGTRAVVTGQLAGPGLFDILTVLGRNRVVRRLHKAVALFE